MSFWLELLITLGQTINDVLPILGILFAFQYLLLRRPMAHLRQVLVGFGLVVIGLGLFLQGLQQALFPLGRLMAEQLVSSAMAGRNIADLAWHDFLWVYAFAAAIGFATTVAEPALIAVSIKAEEVSGGTVRSWGLRIAVAIGVAVGIALGSVRIVTGHPLHYYIVAGYLLVILQTFFAPRAIIPLAYDSGGVTTSTVTVPIVTALGLGLATHLPGRNPLIDGFGLIAFASLFPIISVMGYAQIEAWRNRRLPRRKK